MDELVNNGNIVSKKLETMLPLDVFVNLTKFAKLYAGTGLGKWDYGVALRFLLLKAEMTDYINNLDERLTLLEERLGEKEESIKKEKSVTFRDR
jgi:hypothetical protein